jgi:hypothetical protein
MPNQTSCFKETVSRCYEENRYIICPHTAVGVAYIYRQDTPPLHTPQVQDIDFHRHSISR